MTTLATVQWFHEQHESGRLLSVRDLLSWTTYINAAAPKIGSTAAFVHGAFLVLLDGLGVGKCTKLTLSFFRWPS